MTGCRAHGYDLTDPVPRNGRSWLSAVQLAD
jgi:hypothetical protein